MSTTPVVDLNWSSIAIRLNTDSDAVASHARDQFHAVSDGGCQPPIRTVEVHATVDAARLDAIRELSDGQPVSWRESFAGWWYRCRRDADGVVTLLADAGHEHSHALVTRDFTSWTVVAEDEASLRIMLTRTLRELVREDLLARGGIMTHAAAAVLPDSTGVLLLGAAGAGKTSAAVQIARSGGRCVATDRAFLVPWNGRWQVIGLPTSTRLAAGTVRSINRSSRRPPARELRVPDVSPAPAFGKEPKLSLSNRKVFALLGGGFQSTVRLDRVVLLSDSRSAERGCDSLNRPQHGARALREHVLVPDDSYRSRWLAADPRPETAAGVDERLLVLATELPVFAVSWSPQRHCDDSVADMLSGLPALSGAS